MLEHPRTTLMVELYELLERLDEMPKSATIDDVLSMLADEEIKTQDKVLPDSLVKPYRMEKNCECGKRISLQSYVYDWRREEFYEELDKLLERGERLFGKRGD